MEMTFEERIARRKQRKIDYENSVLWAQLLDCGCAFDVSSYAEQSSARWSRCCEEHRYLIDSDWNGSEIFNIKRMEPGGPKWHWGPGTVMPAIHMYARKNDEQS